MFDKKWNELTEQERAILRAYGLMREGVYAFNGRTKDVFECCSEILKAAMRNDWEVLNSITFPLDFWKQG